MNIDSIDLIQQVGDSGDISLYCTAEAKGQQIMLPGDVAAELLAALLAMEAPQDGQHIFRAPVRPVGVNSFRMTDGGLGIAFHLPNGYAIPFAIPAENIAHLRVVADELEKMSRETMSRH